MKSYIFLIFQTCVLVTHDITHLPYADRIIAMEDGTVAEVGTYRGLMNRNGFFSNFVRGLLDQAEDNDDSIGNCKAIT